MSFDHTLGFIGAGNMAHAIAQAAIHSGVVAADRMLASDPSPQRRDLFESLGIRTFDHNTPVITGCEQILLAIKPQSLGDLANDLAQVNRDEQVIVSIMAGIGSAKIEATLGGPARVIRVMPNTPLMVGAGMAGIARGAHARDGDAGLAERLFGAAGQAVIVDEASIDAITAISGSGPAYLFYLAEAMQRAAKDLGLGEHARLLTTQTLLGAAKLLATSEDDAAELRRKVSSPGGTTQAAIDHLEGNATQNVLVNAIRAAEARSRELGA